MRTIVRGAVRDCNDSLGVTAHVYDCDCTTVCLTVCVNVVAAVVEPETTLRLITIIVICRRAVSVVAFRWIE